MDFMTLPFKTVGQSNLIYFGDGFYRLQRECIVRFTIDNDGLYLVHIVTVLSSCLSRSGAKWKNRVDFADEYAQKLSRDFGNLLIVRSPEVLERISEHLKEKE